MIDNQEPKHHFNKDASWFIKQMNSRKRALPVFAYAAAQVTSRSQNNLFKFIETHSIDTEYDEDGDIKKYAIPVTMHQRHNLLKNTFEDFAIFSTTLPRMALVSVVSLFDAYLTRLLKSVYAVKPEILNGCTRQINFTELVAFGSIEAAKEHIIDKEIETVLRDSHAAQFAWLEKKLKMKLTNLPSWKDFIELTERRNLLVHADGVVSSHYLETCKEHQVNLEKNLKRGDKLEVDEEYYINACNCVTEIGIKLSQVLWRKLIPGELEQAENSFIQATYDLLVLKDYKLAEKVLEITNSNGFKKLNFETSLFLTVNLAIALKGQKKEKECIALLKKTDFSALSLKFKLANQVLNDSFDEAAETLRKIGPDGEVSESQLRQWPLFRWFRKTDQFKAAFEEMYGTEFVVIEGKVFPDGDDESPEETAQHPSQDTIAAPPVPPAHGTIPSGETLQ